MAAIKINSSALAALTTAAINLPGMVAEAAVPVDKPTVHVQYGHYEESNNRMEVDVYHADIIAPITDRLELTYSIDEDIYSGATPNFSAPDSMRALWIKWPISGVQKSFTIPDSVPDTISAASVLTHLWMLPWSTFKEFKDSVNDAVSAGETDYHKLRAAGFKALTNRAIPAGTRTVQAFQQQPLETRRMPVFGMKYYFDDTTLALSGGMSDEPDFHSTFGTLNISHEFNNKLTTVSGGYGMTSNRILRNIGHNSHQGHRLAAGADYPELDGSSQYHNFNLGLAQVFSKNTLLQLNSTYTYQTGYLTNPYKVVYVRGEITPYEYALHEVDGKPLTQLTNLEVVAFDLFREVRPDQRHQWAFSGRLKHYVPQFDAALHADYRYYFDDWGIDSHTFELSWHQPLSYGLSVVPRIRYYSQSQADFFAPFFLAPRADGNYSSDFRLSGYGALSGGVTVTKQFAKNVSLEAGVEYYTHQGALKLGGGGADSYADYDYYLAHAGLKVDLAAVGGGGHDHHRHHHSGAPAPAGVMFSHVLNKAGDVMLGYRYMTSDQSGGMRYGSHAASDRKVLGDVLRLNPAKVKPGCNGNLTDVDCSVNRPTQMTMHMHMLDLMYAPTDWLSLMVMPQLMNMEMAMQTLQDDPNNGHGGHHVSNGIGDTYLGALIKVFDNDMHHLNAGIGVTAPSGKITVTLDGVDSSDSVLQDYGMQLGSGTWDFKPTLTYSGQMDSWFWGAQALAVKRLQDANKLGYALGDIFQGTGWSGYQFADWLSGTVRGVYTSQGAIRGQSSRANSAASPVDFTRNYGGQFWDVGFGLTATVPDGSLAGHSLGVEWLQPVADKFNGFQLERDGALSVTWSYGF